MYVCSVSDLLTLATKNKGLILNCLLLYLICIAANWFVGCCIALTGAVLYHFAFFGSSLFGSVLCFADLCCVVLSGVVL